ncbi:MAG: penicillin-binding protein activator [Pseudomonadota bacterium]
MTVLTLEGLRPGAATSSSALRGLVRAGVTTLMLAALAACSTGPRPETRGTAGEPAGESATAGATERADAGGPVPVAILVPLGAADQRAAESASAILKAAELAVAGPSGSAIRLKSYDTRGTPAGAKAAAEAALADGTTLILGPLFASSTRAAGQAAAGAGVPVLSFSTDTTVAGGNVWVTGFSPENEVGRILSYAAGQGIEAVAVYAPDVPYGAAAMRGVREASSDGRVSVVASEIYPRSFQDIERTSPLFVSNARAAGAQAILMPDFGQGLAIAASFVNFHGMPQPATRYLGIGQWETGETLRAPELVGGWFAGADTAATAAFFQRYATRYGARPPFVAVLGYDAASVAARLAAEAGGRAAFTAQALTREAGFEGAVGALRLRPDGRTDRGLAVLEVGNGRFNVLDPAPRRFAAGS